MTKKLKVVYKKLINKEAKFASRMSSAQLSLAAERMSQEIEERAALRARGELKPDDDVLEVTEWI